MIINELPENFGRILSRNYCAMKYVSELKGSGRRKFIKRAESLRTEKEMKEYVSELAKSLKC